MQNARSLAIKHSATSFLNALLLECPEFKLSSHDGQKAFVLTTLEDQYIYIPVLKYSVLGRHHYTGHYFISSQSGISEITFDQLAKEIGHYLAKKFNFSEKSLTSFYARLENSIHNVEITLDKRFEDFERISAGTVNFKKAEQGLFIGHTFHPTPKSRGELHSSDYETYSAELGGEFPLEWILLSKDLYFQRCSKNFHHEQWSTELFLNEFNDLDRAKKFLRDGFIPFPIHSWQKKHLFKNESIQDYLKNGKLIQIGESDKNWFPTSSLRTVYADHSKFMLKFSLNVRLTNSIRNLLVHELDRGLQIYDVFSHQKGQEFSKDHPQFEVIHEPVYAGILDNNGRPIQESLVVLRFNPFVRSSQAVVVATLTQDSPTFERSLLHHYINEYSSNKNITHKSACFEWLNGFLEVAIKPLIMAQANYGILLGAHQQNMILEIKDNFPVKSYFRDCNGTGYSFLGKEVFREIESIKNADNIFDSTTGNYLFGYYVIINSTFNVMSSIAHSGWINEEELIAEFRSFLLNLKTTQVKDESLFEYLLNSQELMHKGNFLCSLRDINENTERNPLDIYTKIPNPMLLRIK